MVSRWENGRANPDRMYSRLLCDVLGLTARELGVGRTGEHDDARSLLVPPITPELVSHLRSSLDHLAEADNRFGSGAVLDSAQAQAHAMERFSREASGVLRAEVLLLASRFAEFCGWLSQDAGDLLAAAKWSDRALHLAAELDDPTQTSYVLMRKSNVATEAGHQASAAGLAEAAVRNQRTPVPTQVRAVAHRQLALARAVVGEERQCRHALSTATEAVMTSVPPDERAAYVVPSYIASEAGRCLIQLRRPVEAEQVLRAALATWPAELHRDRGLCLTRLSQSLVHQKEVEEGARTLLLASEVAGTTSSLRLRAEVGKVRRELAPWKHLASVGEVTTAIAQLR